MKAPRDIFLSLDADNILLSNDKANFPDSNGFKICFKQSALRNNKKLKFLEELAINSNIPYHILKNELNELLNEFLQRKLKYDEKINFSEICRKKNNFYEKKNFCQNLKSPESKSTENDEQLQSSIIWEEECQNQNASNEPSLMFLSKG